MTREEALEQIKERFPKVIGNDCDVVSIACRAFDALEKQTDDRWIPCSERLPEDYVEVLTCDKKGNIHVMWTNHDYKYPFGISPNHTEYYQPIAWKQLPEPYKESEED